MNFKRKNGLNFKAALRYNSLWKWQTIFFIGTVFALFFSFSCNQQTITKKENSPYRNVSEQADYVGMQTCRGCHQEIYNTFIQTGMGKSWDKATREKSSAIFDKHALVYDTLNDFYYHPFWKNDSLYVLEYRLNGQDTIYKRLECVKYIVGSGQHTNSHLMQIDNFLYQVPITFYTQEKKWDLAPGFEHGANSRFGRIVGKECITCHNFYPDKNESAENYFENVPTGIQCERCHGAGSIHVREKQAGKLIDVAKDIDYTIVNPKKLKRELQISLCQRCHLQGVTVLNEGNTFFDFKPGTPLSSTMHTFIPRFTDSVEHFIMASHADRMKMSKCFLNSEMTCLSCHNPHVKVTPEKTFNQACEKCHQNKTDCKLNLTERKKSNNNCYGCHMPLSGSIDIPHVKIHDHFIRVPKKKTAAEIAAVRRFVRLACVSDANPTALIRTKAYLNYFEEYERKFDALLDSAKYFLGKSEDKESNDFHFTMIRFLFLKNDFEGIKKYTEEHLGNQPTIDAWTNYRIGEAFLRLNENEKAILFFQKSVEQKKNEADFYNKLGVAFLTNHQTNEAEQIFKQCIDINKNQVSGLTNLGYINALNGNLQQAESYYQKALQVNPDYVQALMNYAALNHLQHKKQAAIILLQRILTKEKNNQAAKQRLSEIQKSS